jgi:DNA-directed RNA polymerase subunit M/transcription elongation factor TFIIS
MKPSIHGAKVAPVPPPLFTCHEPTFRFQTARLLATAMCAYGSSYRSASFQRALRIEELLHAQTRFDEHAYQEAATRLAYNIRTNWGAIQQMDNEHLLLAMDAELGHGTESDAWTLALQQRKQRMDALLATTFDARLKQDMAVIADSMGTDGGAGENCAVRCGRCKSEDVTIEQKQTRGADEAMTVFVHCQGCGLRWKM